MAKLFLSHSSRDNASAVAVSDWLRANGWDDLFLDFDPRRGIKGGERWEQALNEAASRCEAVVFLVSRAWLASDWCLKEFSLAAKLNKRLLGVLIEDIPVAELPVYLTDTWQLIDVSKGLRRERFAVSMPFTGESVDASFSSEGLIRLREGLRKAGLDPNFFAWPPAADPGRSPYPGLRPLDAEDAGVFFGREAQIIEALDRLRAVGDGSAVPLLCVLGASGSGKSSFLRAGIWPRLKRDDRNFLPLPVLRPGRAAITGSTGLASTLVAAFASVGAALSREDTETAIRGGIAAVRALLERLAATAARVDEEGPARPPLLVLPIDQTEELFIADRASEGAALLGEWMASGARGLAVVLTIRSDAFERLQTAAQMEGVPLATLTFSPMPKGLYASLIERPAARLKESDRPLVVEPALVRALLDDMEEGGSRDALPLLAFTLERIWLEFGASGRLTLQNYETLGRVRGSIEAAVERAIAAADADPRIPADRDARLSLLRRGLIPWLAGIDPESGSPRRRVARRAEIPDEARPLLDLLIEQRLLSSDVDLLTGEATVEPTHEALLRQWGLLDGWLVEDFALLTSLEGVKRAVREWEANARQEAWLAHQGGRLAEAQGLDARADLATMLDGADRAYLAACRAQEAAEAEALEQRRRERELEQERRVADARKIARRTGMGLVAAIVLAIAAGAFGVVAKQQRTLADQKTIEAQTQTARAEQQKSRAEQKTREAETQRRSAERATRQAQTNAFQAKRNQSAALAALSADNVEKDPALALKLALAAWPRGPSDPTPKLEAAQQAMANAFRKSRERGIFQGQNDVVSDAAFSPDGRFVLTTSWDGDARIFPVRKDRDAIVLSGHSDRLIAGCFSPDGSKVATASADKTARVWDAATGRQLALLKGHDDIVRSVAFSPDGQRIVTASEDKTARIWDAGDGHLIAVLAGHAGVVDGAVFSPDGRSILTASADGTARVFGATSTSRPMVLDTGRMPTTKAIFSRDGSMIATASRDGQATLWDAKSGKKLSSLIGHKDAISDIAFSASGQTILTTSWDRSAILWKAATGAKLRIFDALAGGAVSGRISPDDNRIAVASYDGTIVLWDSASGARLATMKGHTAAIEKLAFSPDGDWVLSASQDHSARLWDAVTNARYVIPGADNGVSTSVDGRFLYGLSADRHLLRWDANGVSAPFEGSEKSAVSRLTASPDGRVLVGYEGSSLEMWDPSTGKKIEDRAAPLQAFLHSVTKDVSQIGYLQLSENGSKVLFTIEQESARPEDVSRHSRLYFWNGRYGKQLAEDSSSEDFCDSARYIVSKTADDLSIFDATLGDRVGSFLAKGVYNCNGDGIAFQRRDNTLSVFRPGVKSMRIFDMGSPVTGNYNYNSLAKVIAAQTADGCRIVSTMDGHLIYAVHRENCAFQFSASGDRMIIEGEASTMVDLKTGAIVFNKEGPGLFSFSQDGRVAVYEEGRESFKLIDTLSGNTLFSGDLSASSRLFISRLNKVLYCICDDNLRAWRIPAGAMLIDTPVPKAGDVDQVAEKVWIMTTSGPARSLILRAADISSEETSALACKMLPDGDVSDFAKKYDLSNIEPLCQRETR